MKIDYSAVRHPAFEIGQDALTQAIIELNSMSPCDAVIMTKSGEVKAGYLHDADILCELIPAGVLARQLTADGLSSYSGKELRKWADAYDRAPLQRRVDTAMQQWLEKITQVSELLPLLRLFPGMASVPTEETGAISMQAEDGHDIPDAAFIMATSSSPHK